MTRLSLIVLLVVLLCPRGAVAAPGHAMFSPAGFWLTESGRTVIRLEPCGTNICGRIHWIIPGGMTRDAKNKDEKLRKRPLCQRVVLFNFRPTGSGFSWGGGTIYKADEGRTYKGSFSMQDDHTLRIRGYIGVPLLGKTQTWMRVSEGAYPRCIP